uniref:Conserved hypothetical plastid protein n=1 Tax=Caulacanthus okamurae TaxID=152008 RepID=A0A6H1U754_9FLOR|nr:conserved hypothetical plastid protein [Caulacanthus okamurae]QIZ74681.1 conserved hypothetical plastid protein [Caulacanthus okamurae]
MFLPKNLCPVPFDQQPLNEYAELKKSCFFAWSILSLKEYILAILALFNFLLISLSPFVWLIVYSRISLFRFILYDVITVNFIFILIFIRLYLGWSYIIKRLISATVFYEESGWYDGQVWVKTADSLTKDRLIGVYEVYPLIVRTKYGLCVFIFLFTLESFISYLL